MAGSDARSARKRDGPVIRIEQVNQGEGQVAIIGCEALRAEGAGLLNGARIGRLGSQFAKQRELAFTDNSLRVVGIGAKDAARRRRRRWGPGYRKRCNRFLRDSRGAP